jgi:transcriptional regulator with GAF, ATPase, and Fis domain
MIKETTFREDLFYRLSVLNIVMPPLRERKEDIPVLANRFLKEYARRMGKRILGLDREVMTQFLDYHWPGNVRELRNVIEAAVVMARKDHLTREDLILTDFHRPLEVRSLGVPSSQTTILREHERDLIVDALKQCGWVQKDAAKMLGISGRVINYKIKRLGIAIPKRRAIDQSLKGPG